jgi:hypothetical protein
MTDRFAVTAPHEVMLKAKSYRYALAGDYWVELQTAQAPSKRLFITGRRPVIFQHRKRFLGTRRTWR